MLTDAFSNDQRLKIERPAINKNPDGFCLHFSRIVLRIWNRDVSGWDPLVCRSNVLLFGKCCSIHLMVQISYRLIGRCSTGKSLQREGSVRYGSMGFSESNSIVGDSGWLCIIDPNGKLTSTDHGWNLSRVRN